MGKGISFVVRVTRPTREDVRYLLALFVWLPLYLVYKMYTWVKTHIWQRYVVPVCYGMGYLALALIGAVLFFSIFGVAIALILVLLGIIK